MSSEGPRPGPDTPASGFTRIEYRDFSAQYNVDRNGTEAEDEDEEFYYDFGDCEYDPYDYPGLIDSLGEDDSDQEPDLSERLGYKPFIAAEELAAVRRNTTNPAEARKRLGEIRRQLIEQQTGLAGLLQTLYSHLEADPDATPTGLVDTAAVELRLTELQYSRIRNGLEGFAQDRANAKALYEAHQGDAAAIFAACFHQPPHGQVNVMLTGANLHFQCFELEDYVFAFTAYTHSGDASKITQAQHDHAARSSGAATRVTASRASANSPDYSVTLENLANNHHTETQTVTETTSHSLINDEYHGSFRIGPLHHLAIKSGGHSWDIAVTGQGQQLHIRHQTSDETTEFDLHRQPTADGRYGGYHRSDRPDDPVDYAYQEMLDFAPGRGYQSRLYIDEHGVTYADHRPDGARVTATEDNYRQVNVITDPQNALLTQAHESQHSFNAYFLPPEENLFTSSWQIAALRQQEHNSDPEAAKQRLLYDEARNFRRKSVDRRARDEILAYFHEGSTPDQIVSTLATDPLYDYRHQPHVVVQTKQWQDSLKATWKETFMLATYDNLSDFPASAAPLPLTDTEVQTATDQVFGPEYQEQLHKWADVLTELQASGHDREEIIALLYQEPANHWVAFASLIEPGLRRKVQERAISRTASP